MKKNVVEKKKMDFRFEIKSINEDGTFEGYGAVFGNVDFGGDKIEPGAFAEAIKEIQASGRKLVMLWQHNTDEPIGVYDEITEDEYGLKVKGRFLLEVARAREAFALMKGGAISGLSIGYGVKKSSRDETTGVRSLLALALYEVSVVTFPMNDDARVATVKSRLDNGELPTIREFEKFLRDAGFSLSQAREIAHSGLKNLLRDAKDESETEDEEGDQPSKDKGKVLEVLKSFNLKME